MSTRRDFFRAAVALPTSWAAFTNALQAAGSDESYWQMVQRQFPLEDDLIYLNAANVCPAASTKTNIAKPVIRMNIVFWLNLSIRMKMPSSMPEECGTLAISVHPERWDSSIKRRPGSCSRRL